MTVRVTSTLEAAIRVLNRQRLVDELDKGLKIRRFAKKSERIRFKTFLASRRRMKGLRKTARYAETKRKEGDK